MFLYFCIQYPGDDDDVLINVNEFEVGNTATFFSLDINGHHYNSIRMAVISATGTVDEQMR